MSFGFCGLMLVNMLKMNLDKISTLTKSNYFSEGTNPWVRCAFGNDFNNSQSRDDKAAVQHNCVFCGKNMTQKEENRIHIQECTEKKDNVLPHSCIFCGLKFPTSAGLKVHMSCWC